ncbi:hypothetical protein QLQ86_17105 [Halomonas sp. LR5S13]|uniref:hypothetical protein n=1 Tax=Halomonas rhizosphaerae TaxID=3043296 RepID=UPI0024A7A7E6|nr:hypothetical protein [Halomonas rhizosphaerae]MDI5922502.1 hypothetical protein [Halomonas rhizosphaerae]
MREIAIKKHEVITFKGEALDYKFLRCCVKHDSIGLFKDGHLITLDVHLGDIEETLEIGGIRFIFDEGNLRTILFNTAGRTDSFDTNSRELLHQIYQEISWTRSLLPELRSR